MRTIAHLSDLHFGAESPDVAHALVAELHAWRPSLVVVSGDLTQRARVAQFAAARTFLAQIPGPQLVVPGNHDVPLFDVFRRFFRPFARYRRHIQAELDPEFVDPELYVAGLNTARSLTWKNGRISVAQIATLRTRLARAGPRWKVVVTHHPFIPPPGTGNAGIELVGRAAQALEVLDTGGVDLLLAGHLHRGYAGDTRAQYPAAHRAIVAAQAGTALSHRTRGGEANAYNRIQLEPDRLLVEVRMWQGKIFAPVSLATYERGESGWRGPITA